MRVCSAGMAQKALPNVCVSNLQNGWNCVYVCVCLKCVRVIVRACVRVLCVCVIVFARVACCVACVCVCVRVV